MSRTRSYVADEGVSYHWQVREPRLQEGVSCTHVSMEGETAELDSWHDWETLRCQTEKAEPGLVSNIKHV